jgi:hypothetical protein
MMENPPMAMMNNPTRNATSPLSIKWTRITLEKTRTPMLTLKALVPAHYRHVVENKVNLKMMKRPLCFSTSN